MLCERCHVREATSFGPSAGEGIFDSPWLCSECAIYSISPGIAEFIAGSGEIVRAAARTASCRYCGGAATRVSFDEDALREWLERARREGVRPGGFLNSGISPDWTCGVCSNEILRYRMQVFGGTSPPEPCSQHPWDIEEVSYEQLEAHIQRIGKWDRQASAAAFLALSPDDIEKHMKEWVLQRTKPDTTFADN